MIILGDNLHPLWFWGYRLFSRGDNAYPVVLLVDAWVPISLQRSIHDSLRGIIGTQYYFGGGGGPFYY